MVCDILINCCATYSLPLERGTMSGMILDVIHVSLGVLFAPICGITCNSVGFERCSGKSSPLILGFSSLI